jgi:hypothetical protein
MSLNHESRGEKPGNEVSVPVAEEETAELELATDEALGRVEPPPK